MGENLITVSKAAQISGYSEGHIRWLARTEKVDSERVGERVLLIDKAKLLAYTEEMKRLGTSKHAG
jgi:hypothetical protein